MAAVSLFGAGAAAVWVWALLEHPGTAAVDRSFLVWGVLVAALGLASGLVFTHGRSCCRTIGALQVGAPPRTRAGALTAATAASTLAFSTLVIDPTRGTVRGALLTVLAIVAAVPAVTGLMGVRDASATSTSGSLAARVSRHLELSRLSRELLAALGSLVTVTTLALGASMLDRRLAEGSETVRDILVYGGLGTALVAAAYLVPRSQLRSAARAMLTELAPLTASEPADLRRELDERERAQRHLGLESSLLSELQTGVVVLSPLLAATTALLLTGR